MNLWSSLNRKKNHAHLDPSTRRAEAGTATESDLVKEIIILRKAVEDSNRSNGLGYRILMGMATGFGTILGATVVVSLAIYLLKPFASIDFLKPVVNEVLRLIEYKGHQNQNFHREQRLR